TWASASKDVGNQTRAVLGSGLPWDEAAARHYRDHPNGAAGNGTVMRAAPSAVRDAAGTLDASIEAALALAAVTHGDPAAGWGAAIVHALVHAGLRGEDPLDALPAVLDRLPAGQSRFHEVLAPDWTPERGHHPDGAVWGCLGRAVWAVRHAASFADAVTRAVDLGGDADTVAAVAGGIAGARFGLDDIPPRWLAPLHGTIATRDGLRTYRTEDLRDLTDRVLAAVT
ncbi:MAG: hypothetical protein GEV08_23735, partial [Acidimicrobiia bacterium]|nr:hypothetical protein [Acidimicrobiia bacterium]